MTLLYTCVTHKFSLCPLSKKQFHTFGQRFYLLFTSIFLNIRKLFVFHWSNFQDLIFYDRQKLGDAHHFHDCARRLNTYFLFTTLRLFFKLLGLNLYKIVWQAEKSHSQQTISGNKKTVETYTNTSEKEVLAAVKQLKKIAGYDRVLNAHNSPNVSIFLSLYTKLFYTGVITDESLSNILSNIVKPTFKF